MTAKSPIEPKDDTREKLLMAAQRQFAERGFHGASIALIAGEVGLTKQALLYHFKRKEDLYAEVLRDIAVRTLEAMRASHDPASTPEQQFEDTILGVYAAAQANPVGSRVLMREVLDDQRRNAPADEWHHKNWLQGMVDRLSQIESWKERSEAEKIACVFQLVSAIEFFTASKSVLLRFYGEAEYERIEAAYPGELRAQIRRILGASE